MGATSARTSTDQTRLVKPARKATSARATHTAQECPVFYKETMACQKKGVNKHDDAPDVLAAIYERVANPTKAGFRVRTA